MDSESKPNDNSVSQSEENNNDQGQNKSQAKEEKSSAVKDKKDDIDRNDIKEDNRVNFVEMSRIVAFFVDFPIYWLFNNYSFGFRIP